MRQSSGLGGKRWKCLELNEIHMETSEEREEIGEGDSPGLVRFCSLGDFFTTGPT